MSLYPAYEDIPYKETISNGMEFKTIFSNFDNLGQERRKRKWLYPKRSVTLQYEYLSLTDARTIFQFFIDRSGAYGSFTFFSYEVESFEGEYVDTCDGSTLVYNLPCKNSSARTIYINSVEQTETTNYTYTALGGADGCDKIELIVPHNDGERITMDFSGNLKLRCRFKEDEMSFETFNNRVRTFGISLQGLLNS